MKKIKLPKGKYAIVDDNDYKWLNKLNWYACRYNRTFYVRRNKSYCDVMYMHRLILNAPKNKLVDHIDGNGLNNQRSNLRLCNHRQNLSNQKLRKDNKSGFKGVFWNKRTKKWIANITTNYKSKRIGYFSNKKEAVKAYNQHAIIKHGKFARLNNEKK